jgi:hypothetical protein
MAHTNCSFISNRERRAKLSRHARCRSQQRGFSIDTASVITAFGERSHDCHGGIRYLMTEGAMTRMSRTLGRNQVIDALAGAYVVVSAEDEQTVITIGHCYS